MQKRETIAYPTLQLLYGETFEIESLVPPRVQRPSFDLGLEPMFFIRQQGHSDVGVRCSTEVLRRKLFTLKVNAKISSEAQKGPSQRNEFAIPSRVVKLQGFNRPEIGIVLERRFDVELGLSQCFWFIKFYRWSIGFDTDRRARLVNDITRTRVRMRISRLLYTILNNRIYLMKFYEYILVLYLRKYWINLLKMLEKLIIFYMYMIYNYQFSSFEIINQIRLFENIIDQTSQVKYIY